ncbi:MAG TPA: hypothetical protein VMU84_13755 [Thermoanaerobaculia bacterium]|nr:hypothetical protein [Thermoanaerobaculia bacterium]
MMYVPLFLFGAFASVLFGIGLIAGRLADANEIREDEERRQPRNAA